MRPAFIVGTLVGMLAVAGDKHKEVFSMRPRVSQQLVSVISAGLVDEPGPGLQTSFDGPRVPTSYFCASNVTRLSAASHNRLRGASLLAAPAEKLLCRSLARRLPYCVERAGYFHHHHGLHVMGILKIGVFTFFRRKRSRTVQTQRSGLPDSSINYRISRRGTASPDCDADLLTKRVLDNFPSFT
jgi:hypothetical protein